MDIEQPIKLVFDPDAHTYTNGDTGEVFTSVTTLIGKYEKSFNGRYWSMYTALKNAGIPVRCDKINERTIDVRGIVTDINTLYENKTYSRLADNTAKAWERKTDVANRRGNKIHNYLENSINESRGDLKALDNKLVSPLSLKGSKSSELVIFKSKHDLDKTDLRETYRIIYDRLLMYIKGGCTLIAEKKLYSSKYMVAGMIDVLVIKGKWFWIVDWKSNKDEMMFESGYYRKYKNEEGIWVRGTTWVRTDDRMAVPISNLPKCKGLKYSLQLSLYSYLMELWGYKPAKNHLEIFHIRPRRVPKLVKVKYYRSGIIRLLEHNNGVRSNEPIKVDNGFGIV